MRTVSYAYNFPTKIFLKENPVIAKEIESAVRNQSDDIAEQALEQNSEEINEEE